MVHTSAGVGTVRRARPAHTRHDRRSSARAASSAPTTTTTTTTSTGSAGHGVAHVHSSDGVLEMQRLAGNRATTLALQRFAEDKMFGTSRFGGNEGPKGDQETATEAPASPTNPILGLRKGDGLSKFGGDPGVKVFQKKLNEVMDAPPLTVDGKWGDQTQLYFDGLNDGVGTERANFVGNPIGTALSSGLDAVHELLEQLRGGGGGGGGDGGQVQGPHNQALEDKFDEITLQYSELLKAQRDGLLMLRTELGTPEKNKPGIIGGLIVKGAELVIDNTLGGGAQTLRNAVKQGTAGLGDLSQKAIDVPFDEAQSGAKGIAKQAVAPTTQGADHNDFFMTQISSLIGASADAVKGFLGAKKDLRGMSPEERTVFTTSGLDARLDRAQQLFAALQTATAEAPQKTHDESLRSWTVTTARQGLKEKGAEFGVPAEMMVTDLKFLGDEGEVPGVLEIEIDFDPANPLAPVRAKSARITGLSPLIRQKLNAKTIGSLGFPMRAKGDVSTGILSFIFDRVNVAVTMDETGFADIHGKTDDRGGTYLALKGQEPTGRNGARRIFEELANVRLGSIGGLGS